MYDYFALRCVVGSPVGGSSTKVLATPSWCPSSLLLLLVVVVSLLLMLLRLLLQLLLLLLLLCFIGHLLLKAQRRSYASVDLLLLLLLRVSQVLRKWNFSRVCAINCHETVLARSRRRGQVKPAKQQQLPHPCARTHAVWASPATCGSQWRPTWRFLSAQ